MYCSELLARMGVTPNYIGFRQTLSAVALARQDPKCLSLVTKDLYPQVAKEYHTSWKSVERNIRSVITIAWARNPTLIRELARYPLTSKPKAAQFIGILVEHDRRIAADEEEDLYQIALWPK